jgi:inositol-phosphate phosphatase/L-galactose 1-phosphate phosphatase/histidinol-phosphatase
LLIEKRATSSNLTKGDDNARQLMIEKPMQKNPIDFVPLLHKLANASGEVIRPYFRKVTFDSKEDESPVTVADKGAEEAIRKILKKERPDDGIFGEEFGATNMDAEWSWIIDPIDGTKAFIRGMPVFATLIGLAHKKKLVMGLIDQPILRERWIGGMSLPTQFNNQRVRTRNCTSLSQAVLNATAPGMFTGKNEAFGKTFKPLEDACKYSLWGGDAYAYGLLANGFIDIQIDATLQLYDYAALVPVIEAAGGVVTDWHGKPLTFESAKTQHGCVLATGNQALHTQAVALLNKK